MSKSYLKGSLLATTVIAGFAYAMPAYAQDASPAPPAGTTDTTAPGGATTAGQTQAGTTPNAGPGAQPQEAVPPAQGQGGEIIVTGTLIRNPNLTSSSPVAVVGQEEIQPSPVDQLAEANPAHHSGRRSGPRPERQQRQQRSATVDLRGLGSKRNLVLLDSTRLVPANTGARRLEQHPAGADRPRRRADRRRIDHLRRRRRDRRRQLHHQEEFRRRRPPASASRSPSAVTATTSAPT